MRSLNMKLSELNKVEPDDLIYSCWVGSDDVSVMDGNDLIRLAKEINKDNGIKNSQPNLSQAIKKNIEDMSGNSFEFVLIKDGKPHKLYIKDL